MDGRIIVTAGEQPFVGKLLTEGADRYISA
jgi:hypothetical protein